MDTPVDKMIGRACVLLFAVLCLAVSVPHAHAEPILFQDGLPEILRIDYKVDDTGKPVAKGLEDQINHLTTMAAWVEERQPKTGFLQKLLGKSQGPTVVSVEKLLAHGEEARGMLVAVEGLLVKRGADDLVLLGIKDECAVTLPEGVPVEGFGDAEPDGLPARVTGMVEPHGAVPLVRATSITPARSLCLLRKARAEQILGKPEEAIKAYGQARAALRGSPSDLAAFASVRAGQIAFDQLRDKKQTSKHYNAAWTTYVSNAVGSDTVYHTWVPQPEDKQWRTETVHDAIAKPLNAINAESFWYSFVGVFVAICGGNAALGCLLLAFVVRTIIWPLTKKQLDSAAAMKKLQPQIKALQAKFADDKQKFQQEFWALCQANGVNPLGGCLPLIIQMPILIMVYRGIRLYVVEFDKASFLWVHNLAGPDMVLLVAYTISMILFQKMTQKTNPQAAMDPQQEQQQKMMMYMMPLMFFFMFRTFPAAFILYWLGTNMVYFAQQWNYMRKVDVGDIELAPKKAGGFVESMARMLSGDPESRMSEDADEQEAPKEVDKRSLEEIRKEDKKGSNKKRRR